MKLIKFLSILTFFCLIGVCLPFYQVRHFAKSSRRFTASLLWARKTTAPPTTLDYLNQFIGTVKNFPSGGDDEGKLKTRFSQLPLTQLSPEQLDTLISAIIERNPQLRKTHDQDLLMELLSSIVKEVLSRSPGLSGPLFAARKIKTAGEVAVLSKSVKQINANRQKIVAEKEWQVASVFVEHFNEAYQTELVEVTLKGGNIIAEDGKTTIVQWNGLYLWPEQDVFFLLESKQVPNPNDLIIGSDINKRAGLYEKIETTMNFFSYLRNLKA